MLKAHSPVQLKIVLDVSNLQNCFSSKKKARHKAGPGKQLQLQSSRALVALVDEAVEAYHYPDPLPSHPKGSS